MDLSNGGSGMCEEYSIFRMVETTLDMHMRFIEIYTEIVCAGDYNDFIDDELDNFKSVSDEMLYCLVSQSADMTDLDKQYKDCIDCMYRYFKIYYVNENGKPRYTKKKIKSNYPNMDAVVEYLVHQLTDALAEIGELSLMNRMLPCLGEKEHYSYGDDGLYDVFVYVREIWKTLAYIKDDYQDEEVIDFVNMHAEQARDLLKKLATKDYLCSNMEEQIVECQNLLDDLIEEGGFPEELRFMFLSQEDIEMFLVTMLTNILVRIGDIRRTAEIQNEFLNAPIEI